MSRIPLVYRAVAVVVVALTAGCANGNAAPVAPIRTSAPATATPSPTLSTGPSPTATPLSTPSPTATPTPRPTATPTATPTPSPTPSTSPAPTSLVYVVNPGSNTYSVTVYGANPIGMLDEAPVATIVGSNTGLNYPTDVAVDPSGKIYVANAGNAGGAIGGSITVYAASPSGTLNETPLATIAGSNTGLAEPYGIALDGSGKIYVTNYDGGNGNTSITVYAANPSGTLNETPLATIAGSNTGLTNPFGIALDSSGKLYVANVINATSSSILVYAASPSGTLNESPIATIAGSNTGLHSVYGVGLDATGRVYAASSGGGSNSVNVYPANPSGSLNESPSATIAGSNTGLASALGLTVAASGLIYVTNSNTTSVTDYAANPAGTLNEAPLGTIAGGNTGLAYPLGIAVR